MTKSLSRGHIFRCSMRLASTVESFCPRQLSLVIQWHQYLRTERFRRTQVFLTLIHVWGFAAVIFCPPRTKSWLIAIFNIWIAWIFHLIWKCLLLEFRIACILLWNMDRRKFLFFDFETESIAPPSFGAFIYKCKGKTAPTYWQNRTSVSTKQHGSVTFFPSWF